MSSMHATGARETYLFGAGGAASWVLHGFRREGIPVTAFLDDAAGSIRSVSGTPVLAPNDAAIEPDRRARATVICAVMNPSVDEGALKRRLTEYGWGEVCSFGEYGRMELRRSGRRCAMLDARVIERHADDLAEVRRLLSDEHSRVVFDSFLAFCRALDDTGFPEVSAAPYFPPDLPRWPHRLRMIDCGAFDGDSVRSAQAHGYTIDACMCFEPDPRNFTRLAKAMRDVSGAAAFPCGVAQRTEMCRFAAQGDSGSAMSASGDVHVQCVALDDAIPHFAPNLIKLDIEGSEEAALRGAESLIAAHRPGLAVSVYHLSTDIWRIPLFLSKVLGQSTRFALRRHSRTIADTVLYVYPDA